MGWQTHFTFKFEVSGPYGKTLVGEKTIAVPVHIPLDELLASHFGPSARELTLEDRKILWAYQNISSSTWKAAARDLSKLIQEHPGRKLNVRTSQAGVAVVMTLLNTMKLPEEKKVHFEFEQAPIEWLEKNFAPVRGKSRRAA